MPVTDVHNHAIPRETLGLFERDSVYGVSIVDGDWHGPHHVPFPVASTFSDPAAKLEQMDQLGIDVAVLSAPPPLFFYEIAPAASTELCRVTNEGLVKFSEHRPDRFRWFAHLPMQEPDAAVEVYRDAVASGAAGAALGTSIAGRRLDDPAFADWWATAERAGRPVLLHPAFNEAHSGLGDWYLQNAIGNPMETTVTVERLICAGVLHRHPDLRLILLHAGGYLPYQIGRLRHARSVRAELADAPADVTAPLSQMYFDTITHDAEALRFLVSKVGLAHVVLGTDLPFDMAMQTPMETLREALPEEAVRAICEANPAAALAGAAR